MNDDAGQGDASRDASPITWKNKCSFHAYL